ncbi:MAG: GGDEF domain-containing protein [Anaerocolumna sp.]
MKEFDLIHEGWRNKLRNTNFILTLLVFLVEIIMFFILKKSDLIEQPINEYLRCFLIVPTILDCLVLYIGNVVMNHMPSDSQYINYIPILQMSVICMIIASTHNIFSVTLCLFCFPLFTTVMFSDKKMTRIIGIICSLFLILSLLYRKASLYRPKNDRYFYAEAIVSIAILIATYILCNVLIRFAEEKTNIIHHSYLKQIQMQELLNRDQKTGLFGHTIFMNTLDSMIEKANKTLKPFAVAVIDIDDFKKVNDTHGHLKGDQIIIVLADLMKKYFNENQVIARYGGEEFAIIFSGNELNHGIDLLEKLRIAFESQKYSFMEDKITISIGIAEWRQGWTSEQLFEAADSAMYSSKSGGKNRTIIYEI